MKGANRTNGSTTAAILNIPVIVTVAEAEATTAEVATHHAFVKSHGIGRLRQVNFKAQAFGSIGEPQRPGTDAAKNFVHVVIQTKGGVALFQVGRSHRGAKRSWCKNLFEALRP